MKLEEVRIGMRVLIRQAGTFATHLHAGKTGRVIKASMPPHGRPEIIVELDTGGKMLFWPDELEPAEVEQP